ncbi:RNA polymerase sigma factor SigI [Paenibacillus sp. PL2-23]|uniref:RNA polymerase sigma factor SigI n=1 Tax=Paenibacillus sp. PL2-23 TaxID=2100729 RepID=UPI0030F8277E
MLILLKRFLRKSVPSSSELKLGPEQYIAKIRQGEEALREQFIAQYSPYIAKVTSRFCKRYIDPSADDEFSVALVAFNEAINQFDSAAGSSFLGFAKTVIQRRLIDHARKEKRHLQTVPYSAFDSDAEDGSTYNALENKQSLQAYDAASSEAERRMEIEELNHELELYGITFMELVELSPKHADSRAMLLHISAVLAGDNRWMEGLRLTQKLPIKELMEACGVSRKTLERNRKYIIAIAIIRSGVYPFMQDYLGTAREHDTLEKEVSR